MGNEKRQQKCIRIFRSCLHFTTERYKTEIAKDGSVQTQYLYTDTSVYFPSPSETIEPWGMTGILQSAM